MLLSELIKILQDTLTMNGEMQVVGIANETFYSEIEINCPDEDSPCYIELYQ